MSSSVHPGATITELLETRMLRAPGQPVVMAREYVAVVCGCQCWVGVRLDLGETCTVAVPCEAAGHRERMDEFYARFGATLDTPLPVKAVEVIAQVMNEVFSEGVQKA